MTDKEYYQYRMARELKRMEAATNTKEWHKEKYNKYKALFEAS